MILLTQRLQELRKESGMTQQQVADAIQTTLRQYQRFEKGEQKPGYDNLIKLADCFQVSLDYLAGRSDCK
ncbi:MAG: helix-turn-helix transcriptional regulator [Lawsonibacter sp.]|nr:helix-turn-helix transcriptional regulator [Lawsonibacter sp.]